MKINDNLFEFPKGMFEAQAKFNRVFDKTTYFIKPSINQITLQSLERKFAYDSLRTASLIGPLSAAQKIIKASENYDNLTGINAARAIHEISTKSNHAILGSAAVLAAMTLMDKSISKTKNHNLIENSIARAIFETQQTIFQKIEGSFQNNNGYNVTSISIESLNALKNQKTDLFDAIIIRKIGDVIEHIEEVGGNVDSFEESIAEINELVDDEDIQSKLVHLTQEISKLFSRKVKKATHDDFEKIIATRQYIILFVHNHILGRAGFSLQSTNVLVDLIDSWIVKLIIVSSIITPKIQNVFAPLIGIDSEPEKENKKKPVNYYQYNNVYNYNLSNQFDIAFSNCPVYLRNSVKTKNIGTLKKGTTVEILIDKPKWCFIRANINCFNKKTKGRNICLLQVWVEKCNLESKK